MITLSQQIQDNFNRVSERIARAAQSANRRADDVHLVVVTKGQPSEVIQMAVQAGAQILGENYPEETLPKMQQLGPAFPAAWHMIGHLQSRKSAIVAENFDMLQSLDSLRLAEKLDRLLADRSRTLPVLIEVNVSGEESKFGLPAWDPSRWTELASEIEQILALPRLVLRGLMTMPPLYADPEQTRPFFVRMRRLSEFLARRFSPDLFAELSMGTSADFEAAVQEGATFVRVGTAVVGPRPKKTVQGIIDL